jgi:hypothetical protein
VCYQRLTGTGDRLRPPTRDRLTDDPTAAASSSTIAPSGLLCQCQFFAQKFFKNFRGVNGYNAYPVGSLGIESGNVPPNISIKAITPPGVTA